MTEPAKNEKIPLLVIVGSTASGKTELAARLAREFSGEVISADSMQIYKGMPVATAAPTEAETLGVPHHLIGFAAPGAAFSVADYVRLAHEKIREVHGRGRLPVLAGGTGLYVSSVLSNVAFPAQRSDAALRESLREQAEREGAGSLLERLAKFDPETAARLHPNDLGRIIRAIEIYELTGVPMTRHLLESKKTPPPYESRIIGITFRDRQKLYARIDARVSRMLENGLLDEARRALEAPGKTAAQALGHKEFAKYLRGGQDLHEAVETLKRETRRYAKRQLTWFSKLPGVYWIERDAAEDVYAAAKGIVLESGILSNIK